MLTLDLYEIKNQMLREQSKEVSPESFYRDLFPKGSFEEQGRQDQKRPNGILCSIQKGKGTHRLIFDDHKELLAKLDDEFVIISPISYYGLRRTASNASMLYGICFDLDEVGEEQLQWILDRLENPNFPRATYIANSGNGLHLYFLLKEPIPLYKSIHHRLNVLKHALTDLIWNRYTSRIPVEKIQYQGIFQGFRAVGSRTKNNHRVTVYKTGGRVDIDYLNRYVNKEYRVESLEYESTLTLKESKKKYPEWYRKVIIEGDRCQKKWAIKRDLYDWWLNKIRIDPQLVVGHRYWCLCILASYAYKCSFYDKKKNPNPVTEEELRKDAYSLFPRMLAISNDFTEDDIESALNFFQESYITFPRDQIEIISGLDIPKNKRNGRTQSQHLERARAVQEIDYPNGEWRNLEGRPKGSGTKEDKVREWQQNNPEGRKIDCHRETGLSRVTINKWWNG